MQNCLTNSNIKSESEYEESGYEDEMKESLAILNLRNKNEYKESNSILKYKNILEKVKINGNNEYNQRQSDLSDRESFLNEIQSKKETSLQKFNYSPPLREERYKKNQITESLFENSEKSSKFRKSFGLDHSIIGEKDYLDFMYNFGFERDDQIEFKLFLQSLIQEFDKTEKFNEIKNTENYYILYESLQNILTTINQDIISENALKIFIGKKGFRGSFEQFFENIINKIFAERNEVILQEMEDLKEMLELKQKEICSKEQALLLFEEKLNQREKEFKNEIQLFSTQRMTDIEDKMKLKSNTILKRIKDAEALTKSKLKVLEQVKKTIENSNNGNEMKFKAKVTSLQKSNDFLKAKTIDLEKKLTKETDAYSKLTKQHEKLKEKLEKIEKSIDKSSKENKEINELPKDTKNKQTKEILNSSFKLSTPNTKKSQSHIKSQSQERNSEKIAEQSDEDLKTSISFKQKKITIPVNSHEINLLCSVIGSLLESASLTFNLIVKKNIGRSDYGELYFPNFTRAIGNVVDLIGSLNFKKQGSKSILPLLEFFHCSCYSYCSVKIFKKTSKESENLLQIENLAKNSQDHLNEIMHSNKRGLALGILFNPLSQFWKRRVKDVKLREKGGNRRKIEKSMYSPIISIFSSNEIQEEFLDVLKNISEKVVFEDKLEALKVESLVKLYSSSSALFLCSTEKQFISFIKSLLNTLDCDNQTLSQYLINLYLESKAIECIFHLLGTRNQEENLIDEILDFFLYFFRDPKSADSILQSIMENNQLKV